MSNLILLRKLGPRARKRIENAMPEGVILNRKCPKPTISLHMLYSILISTVQKYMPRGHARVMLMVHVIVTCLPVSPVRVMLIVHVTVTCLPVSPVRVILIVHVIVSCLPVGPVLEGCLAYFVLYQSNTHPHDCSDEPLIDNNLLSAQDLTRILLACALLHFHVY